MDLTPLFNWNTKQVFLSLTASYESPKHGTNDIVVWDRIVKKNNAKIQLRRIKNKYGLRDYSKSFEYVTPLTQKRHRPGLPRRIQYHAVRGPSAARHLGALAAVCRGPEPRHQVRHTQDYAVLERYPIMDHSVTIHA